jgi:NAD(P)-dependent dehydrogenase (short-subunit alcohol dehydrogenase family)
MSDEAPAQDLDMTGKTVIVTGGTKGIGRVISTTFLQRGADVVVCGRNDPDWLPRAGEREALFVAADVRDPEQVEAVVAAAVAGTGRLDVLINNAGGAPEADSATVSPRFNASIIALNLTAPFTFAQQANAVMQGQDDGGVIINVASVSGVRPSPGSAAYGAAKAGLLSLTTTGSSEPSRPISTTGTRPASRRWRRPSRSAAWVSPRTSPTPACSWRHPWRPT